METMVSNTLINGRQKLAARKAEQQRIREENDRKDKQRRREFRSKLIKSLHSIFPDELDEYIEIPEDIRPGYVKLALQYPGCAMVLVEMQIGEDGTVHLDDKPFVVPGVLTILPAIDPEYGYFAGDVNVIYYPGRHERTDEGWKPEETDDLDLALALAEDRQTYIEQQQALIAAKAAELEPARLVMEAGLKAQAAEPVYTPVDAGNPTESLINVAELVRLVRDLIGEALEERNL